MRFHDQYVEEQTAKDPAFAAEFAAAKAELHLGMHIAALRDARGWSQRDLAKRAGMPQSVIARYEKAGRTPSAVTLWRLANALDATFILGPNFCVNLIDAASHGLSSPTTTSQPSEPLSAAM